MKLAIAFSFVILLAFGVLEAHTLSVTTTPRINFYEEAKTEDFNKNEIEILQPVIDVLQAQYNKFSGSIDLNRSLKTDDSIIDSQLNELLHTIKPEFAFEDDLKSLYNASLPNISILKGLSPKGISSEEAADIEDLFQENIDDANQTIQNLIMLSNETEARLISINKIKIIKFIYKMILKIYALGIRGGRTAYCTYSSVPAINATLKEGSINIGSCYNYTETSVGRLRRDVKSAITQIRENVNELVNIYKKIAKRQSLLGKLLTVLLNISKITKDIKESKTTAIATVEEVKTDGPAIAAKIQECATSSIPSFVKELNDTITDLTTCINFVDDSTIRPEPEPESSEESIESRV